MKSEDQTIEISRLEAALARQTDLVDKILLISDHPMYIFDFRQGMFRILNRLPFSFAGYTSEQVATLSPDTLMALLHPEDKPRVLDYYQDLRMAREGEVLELEFRLRHSYGNWHWVSVRETPFERSANDEVHSILGVAEDITAGRMAEEKVAYLNTHDNLTGLYNRSYFQEEITRLERGRRFPVTVLMADIDNLKQVNETRGFLSGDQLIRNAAEILASCFRVEDVVARIGGDEFGVLLPEIASVSIEAINMRVNRRVEAFNLSHPSTPLSLSIGIAVANDKEQLRLALAEAERRMLAQKLSKNNLSQ